MIEPAFQWKRFWCPRSGGYSLGDGGYLVNPEGEYAKWYKSEAVSFSAIAGKPCLALLGEPGIGKSTAMRAEREAVAVAVANSGARLLWIDLKEYGDEGRLLRDVFESVEFTEWVAGSHSLHLFMDSLDECRLQIPNIASILLGRIQRYKEHISRLHLRIACRTADWPSAFEEGLPELWGSDSVGFYELAPLRRSDVTTAAEASSIDARKFLAEIARVEAQPLAIKPITLKFLLNVYQRDQQLPATQAELYLQGCHLLCQETSVSRRDSGRFGAMSANQRFAVAARIAAITIFCGRSSLYTAVDLANTSGEDLPIAMIQGGTESTGTDTFTITEQGIREVLGTGLFSGRGPHRLGFAHQTYAEFLAARYLVERGLDLTQMMTLVQHKDDESGRIVPQLGETAAWLASMDDQVFRVIMEADPQVLLRSDVAKAQPQDRASLVKSLLRLLDAEQLTDAEWDLRRHYRKLKHPTIATQIEPYIRDPSKGVIVRRVAIDIAEACDAKELQDLLAGIALDPKDTQHIREQAAHAIKVLGDAQVRARLHPLVNSAPNDDPDDQLKGCALQALWPGLISAEEVFASITTQKNQSYGGTYFSFLAHDLPKSLSVQVLPCALAWVGTQPRKFDMPFALRRLADDIVLFAWENMDSPGVLPALAKALVPALEHYEGIIDDRQQRKEAEALLSDDRKRHNLVVALLPFISDVQTQCWGLAHRGMELVRSDDLFWLIGRLLAEESSQLEPIWARLIRTLFNYTLPDHVDAVLRASQASLALAAEFQWMLTPVRLGSAEAVEMKNAFEESKKWQREGIPPRLEPPPRERIDDCLRRFESGDCNAWWLLNQEMTLEDNSTYYGDGLEADLTKTPGWKNADPSTKARIIETAKCYLAQRDATPSEWLGRNVIYWPAASGYKAFLLLFKETPGYIESLPGEVWQKWAPIIVGYPAPIGVVDEETPHLELISQAYKQAPEEVTSTLLTLIDQDNAETHGNLCVLRKVMLCWDTRLSAALLVKARDGTLKPSCLGEVLADLLEHGSAEAKEYAASLVPIPIPPSGVDRERAHAAAVALLTYADDGGWRSVWPAIQSDASFGKDLFLAVSHTAEERHTGKLARRLTDEQVADLYVWLARQFPHAEDPKYTSAHSVVERESVADFRDSLLSALKLRATPQACHAIARIAQELPELAWLKWVLVEAKKVTLRQTWVPPTPDQVLTLAQRPGLRLVQSANALLNVLIESLGCLEQKLQGETPASPDLWDEVQPGRFRPKDEGHLADYIKRHLEEDLRRCGIVAMREVEIRRGEGKGKSRGERTDIHITGVIEGVTRDSFDRVRVIIETKGCWHRELKTAMKSQLVDRYLKDNDCQHGLYLVGWYNCPQWDKADSRRKHSPRRWAITDAQQFFGLQAKSIPGERLVVKAFVIDAALR